MTPVTQSAAARLSVVGALAAATALAWLAMLAAMSGMHTGMAGDMPMAGGWSGRELAVGVGMWAAMMTAMMLPSTVPMTVVFAGLTRRRLHAAAAARLTALFVAGYLAVWWACSLAAAVAQQALSAAGLLACGGWRPGWQGVVLIGAGVYQLTPAKHACLRSCRSPLGFLLAHWRDGPAGALLVGGRHGLWCLGCCLPLMGVLYAVGVMSLVWMAALALLVLAEKALPAGAALARLAGVGLVGLGAWTLAPPVSGVGP